MPPTLDRRLDDRLEERLRTLARALVDDERARVVQMPSQDAPGFWFGSGGIARETDGAYCISGRYRDHGDSRTGLEAGRRGWKLVVARSSSPDGEFQEIWSAEKAGLGTSRGEVISIEGSAIFRREDGTVELYVSSEKERPYPSPVSAAQKAGTGIWDIDMVSASSFDSFDATRLETLLWNDDPTTIHVKDPAVSMGASGETVLIFCHHGYNWSSSSTGWMDRQNEECAWGAPSFNVMPHGLTWDVAVTRVTSRLRVPRVGAFASVPRVSLFFYDGSECVREHASSKPKGYSCEEIGGLAYGLDDEAPSFVRLSPLGPFFVSARGTGCHRYVDAYGDEDGLFAVWQMSNENGAQPLYGNFLGTAEVERILS